jgi:hypothetical protein
VLFFLYNWIIGIKAVFSSFIFLCACPRQGLDTRSWDSNQSIHYYIGRVEPNNNPWEMKKKDDGARDPIKMLLKESLARQRNEMMDNFVHILRGLPMGEASSSGSHATLFKV